MNKHLFFTILIFAYSQLCSGQVQSGYINSHLESPNELSVAANPLKPGNWVVGANTTQLYITFDSGQTWVSKEQVSSLGPYGDPVILADSNGNFYHAHLSKTPGKPRPDYLDRMIVQRSLDGGLSWNDGIGVGFNQGKVQDKEWLSIDEYAQSPYKGTIYMSWTEFDVYGSNNPEHRSRIRFAKSSDQSQSFDTPIIVSDGTGDCRDGDNTLEGATTAIGTKGEVFIVWAGQGKIWFDKSMDGGKSFGKDLIIGDQKQGWTYSVPGIYRSNAMPFIKYNPVNGNLHVIYADSIAGQYSLILLSSSDQGKNWTQEILDTYGANHIFFPNLEIDQTSGTLGILYYQNNSSMDSISPKLLLIDTLKNSKNIQLGPSFPIPGEKIFFGDYIDLCTIPQGFLCVWTSFESKKLRARFAVYSLPK